MINTCLFCGKRFDPSESDATDKDNFCSTCHEDAEPVGVWVAEED
jgi:DNA-directed RNA polymerase subunit RPC12/RpoP